EVINVNELTTEPASRLMYAVTSGSCTPEVVGSSLPYSGVSFRHCAPDDCCHSRPFEPNRRAVAGFEDGRRLLAAVSVVAGPVFASGNFCPTLTCGFIIKYIEGSQWRESFICATGRVGRSRRNAGLRSGRGFRTSSSPRPGRCFRSDRREALPRRR